MTSHRWGWLLLLVTGTLGVGCAHGAAQTQSALVAPLDSVDCYDTGDVYRATSSPCMGFLYGDYEQYPLFAPDTRQVILTGDRHRTTRIVMRRPEYSNESTASGWGSFADSDSAASAAVPRMAPVTVSAPSNHPTVSSRSN